MTMQDHMRLIHRIAREDGAYRPEAFLFVSEAIARTVEWIRKGKLQTDPRPQPRGGEGEFHVSGKELLQGIQRLAAERWGGMAPTVFAQWGITRTEDFGRIVFLMVNNEEMHWKKRDCDSEEDFAGGFDFATAFEDLA